MPLVWSRADQAGRRPAVHTIPSAATASQVPIPTEADRDADARRDAAAGGSARTEGRTPSARAAQAGTTASCACTAGPQARATAGPQARATAGPQARAAGAPEARTAAATAGT